VRDKDNPDRDAIYDIITRYRFDVQSIADSANSGGHTRRYPETPCFKPVTEIKVGAVSKIAFNFS
jgi:hypothetical protein